MRMLAAHIPNCQFVTVPEAGHAAFWEQRRPGTVSFWSFWASIRRERGGDGERGRLGDGEALVSLSPSLLSPLPYGLQTARHLPELKTPAVST